MLPQGVEDRLKSRFAAPEVRTEKRNAGVLEIVLAVSGVVLIVIYQEPDVGGDAWIRSGHFTQCAVEVVESHREFAIFAKAIKHCYRGVVVSEIE